VQFESVEYAEISSLDGEKLLLETQLSFFHEKFEVSH
jgi:hypothetical protein